MFWSFLLPVLCKYSENDNLSNIITKMDSELNRINKLQGSDNRSIWKFQIQVYLKSIESWELVNGTNKMPELPADANETQKARDEDDKAKRMDGHKR